MPRRSPETHTDLDDPVPTVSNAYNYIIFQKRFTSLLPWLWRVYLAASAHILPPSDVKHRSCWVCSSSPCCFPFSVFHRQGQRLFTSAKYSYFPLSPTNSWNLNSLKELSVVDKPLGSGIQIIQKCGCRRSGRLLHPYLRGTSNSKISIESTMLGT